MKKLKLWITLFLFVLLMAGAAGLLLYHYTQTDTVHMVFEESSRKIANPSRGFYYQVDTSDGKLPDRIKEENLKLILLTLDLKEEKEGEISTAKLKELEQMLQEAHEAEVKVIFRAAYGFHSEDAYKDPENVETVIGHIRQIAPVLNGHREDVLCVQAGFLGPWGEWHHSNLLDGENDENIRNRVLKEWTDILDESLTVNVRRPRFIRDAMESGIGIGRLGLHDDALLADEGDMGTYDDEEYTREGELSWAFEYLAQGVNGGEMPSVSEYTQPENVIKEFGQLHLTYLNKGYNRDVLEQWKKLDMTEGNAYDVIERRLGYRIFLEAARINDGLRDFNSIELDCTFQNAGFAPIPQDYRLYAVIDTGENIHYAPIEPSLSNLDGQESGNAHIEIALSDLYDRKEGRPGSLRVGLLVSDTDNPAENRDRVQLANDTILWENGINYIGQYNLEEQDKSYVWKCLESRQDAVMQDTMRMVIFKAGKADAILLSSEGKNILIDTGEEDDGDKLLTYMEKNGIDRIDEMILTHFDKDHVGGADQIIDRMEVGRIYQPDYDSDSRQFLEYDESVRRKKAEVKVLSTPVNFMCGAMEVHVYPPLNEEYEEENDYSLITSIVYGDTRMLFAGDAEKERMEELTDGSQQIEGGLPHEFLKLPHHGRMEKGLETFLNQVAPSSAVITCSDKNPPDSEVLTILQKMGVEVFLTADGNVYGESDGKTLDLWQ